MTVAAPDPMTLAADLLDPPAGAWRPYTHQVPPLGLWRIWMLMAGRGAGKTDAGAHDLDQHVRGAPCLGVAVPHRVAVIAPTLDDAKDICVVGETGLLKHDPRIEYTPGGKRGDLVWPNGAIGNLYGASKPTDPNRLRGPQHCRVWAEEVAAWARLDETLDMMMMGLRLGLDPRAVFTTTPRPRKRIVEMQSDPMVAITRATTLDNPSLPQTIRRELYERYGGTRLGRQELEGELLLDVPGALWAYEWIDANRVTEAPELSRVVVAVDPATTHDETSDETGIGAVGKGYDGDYYVLRDASVRMSPLGWAKRTIDVLDDVGGVIVAEKNQGGEMVETTIRQVRKDAPIVLINASKSKEVRAQPVAMLYEQGKVHHVGAFPELEDQQTAFPVANEHDDRLDWLVHAITYLANEDRTKSRWGAS